MKNQIIITLGREHGSGGHYIADMIAQELGLAPHRQVFQFS